MDSGHGEKLSRLQEQAIAALMRERSIIRAASSIDVAESTLRRWLRDPLFLTEYRAWRRQVVERTIGELQEATGAAVRTLKKNLRCRKPASENRAALGILTLAFKGLEQVDLQKQLEELKALLEGKPHG